MLSDDSYFGHKSYLTCYCQEDFRPKLPSQQAQQAKLKALKPGEPIEEQEDEVSEASYATSHKMLGKLKNISSMAISVTTGKKLSIKKNPNQSNVIPGFGYALMDIFENEYVNMESITKSKEEMEESRSPFKSPKKRGLQSSVSVSPTKLVPQSSVQSRDELRKARREERKAALEEFERREREPPKQYQLLQIKTAVTRYPTINYIQPFTNEEIMEGKKCLLNHMKRTQKAEAVRQHMIEMSTTKKRHLSGSKQKFSLNIREATLPATPDRAVTPTKNEERKSSEVPDGGEQSERNELKQPRKRAPGGVWIESKDFPHAFEHVIVYHNMNRFQHKEIYSDVWTDANTPFISNEKDVYLKLELDEEAFEKYKEEQGLDAATTLADLARVPEHEEVQGPEAYPGEVKRGLWSPDQVLLAFAPNPTDKAGEVMPRYFMRFNMADLPEGAPDAD